MAGVNVCQEHLHMANISEKAEDVVNIALEIQWLVLIRASVQPAFFIVAQENVSECRPKGRTHCHTINLFVVLPVEEDDIYI